MSITDEQAAYAMCLWLRSAGYLQDSRSIYTNHNTPRRRTEQSDPAVSSALSDSRNTQAPRPLGYAHGAQRLELDCLSHRSREKAESTFDLITDTVPVRHDVSPCMPLLDVDNTLVIAGQAGPIDEI